MKKLFLMFLVLLFFEWGFTQAQVKAKECEKPKQNTGFFFGTPSFLFEGYFDNKDIDFSLIKKSTKVGYSLYGGFIDSDHMGEAFLWTVYYQNKTYEKLIEERNEFILEMYSLSLFHIKVDYPSAWKDLKFNEKRKIAKDISIDLAQYLAYNWTVYHEMLTWYGYRSTGVFSEFGSAFSPEDLYSDLLGTIVAATALRDEPDFETASVKILKFKLTELGMQPKNVAEKALEDSKNKWWNGKTYPLNKVYKRNFDIGIDDGFLSPMLIESIDKNAKPKPLAAPKLSFKNDFHIKVEIEPKEKQKDILLKIVNKGKEKFLEPAVDFEKIMKEIEKDSVKKLK